MAAKSYLLENIIQTAKTLSEANGRNYTSVDFFVISLLDVVKKSRNHELAEELKTEETEKEIAAIEAILQNHDVNVAMAFDRMAGYACKDNPANLYEKILFGKLSILAEKKAQREGKEVIGADLYLELLLEEPSEAVSKFILGEPEEEQSLEQILQTGRELHDSLFPQEDDDDEDDEDIGEEDDGADQVETEALTGAERLAQTVERVNGVQQRLLNVIYGQDHAIGTFVSGYFQAELASMTTEKRTRPRATFLFAGPPGVGKTFLAEQTAEALGLPYKRFDMSEYCEKESNIEFCGSDKVYKNGKEGNVTSFVAKNPKCILLFDEIEKAHLNVIYLFLQLLDAGRLRDNYTDEEVSFTDAIVIFTTNVGKKLYEDPTIGALSCVPRKTVIKALNDEINPVTGAPSFPAAICSRFAFGNVIMFNHLGAHNLLKIVDGEFGKQVQVLGEHTGVKITIDRLVPYALMFSEGGNADARTIRGKSSGFIYQELYELFRLASSDKNGYSAKDIRSIAFKVSLPKDKKICSLFSEESDPAVLVIAGGERAAACRKSLRDIKAYFAGSLEKAKEILSKHDVKIILCDIRCGVKKCRQNVLNLEDTDSVGRDFFLYAKEHIRIPLYLLQERENEISREELLSFTREGARGVLSVHGDKRYNFYNTVREKCNIAHQQHNMLELAKANKVLTYQTAQQIYDGGARAVITLYDFRLKVALDAGDAKNVLSDVSKPDVRFDQVIGAEDAKDELRYFVDFLKNPAKFMRKGVKAPKGILLYGPPGTGKTLLAKAMAGESDVTFIAAEGNQFLKRYVGEGPESVHELFNTARKYAPSILFIDEIDAIGGNRQSDQIEASANVLTSLLTEMDGFHTDTDKPVFVLAATNYDVEPGTPRSLDPALLRRFDRKIFVDLPNKAERAQFIRLKASKNVNLVLSDEQIENIAVRSTAMSLAELELVIELALRNAIKSDGYVNDAVLEEAFETYYNGEEKKWDPATLTRTARHEAGHAFVCWMSGETPSYLTVVARGSHGGYMQHGDNEDKGLYTKEELLSRVRTSLGGRAAEVVYYGEQDGVSTGAVGDLYSATKTVESMICSYGMDEVVGLGSVNLNLSSNSQYYSVVRERVNDILKEEFEKTKELIAGHKNAIDKLVEALLSKNHLKGNEIDELLGGVAERAAKQEANCKDGSLSNK